MPDVVNILESVTTSHMDSQPNQFRTIEDPHISDDDFIESFRANRSETGKRMDWALCFRQGKEQGQFSSYKNKESLKATFNNRKSKK